MSDDWSRLFVIALKALLKGLRIVICSLNKVLTGDIILTFNLGWIEIDMI
jgi:hypothetical protein